MKVFLHGMHGLGDNFHQRAVVKHYLAQGDSVALVTPWPQVYYDLPVEIYLPENSLRTQSLNMIGYRHPRLGPRAPYGFDVEKRVWYTKQGIQKTGAFLTAMFDEMRLPPHTMDFRFEAKAEWVKRAHELIDPVNQHKKPVLFYRPLVIRSEWPGCDNRNPQTDAYEYLINLIRDKFFVVSVADLAPGIEWISGGDIPADLKFHRGELSFELMAGLMSMSDAVFCSPGFALVMAQALVTPVICVFGGRENSKAYSPGAEYTPTVGIDPVNACMCFDHLHNCDKRIDLTHAEMLVNDLMAVL